MAATLFTFFPKTEAEVRQCCRHFFVSGMRSVKQLERRKMFHMKQFILKHL